MRNILILLFLGLTSFLTVSTASAQGTAVAFGALKADPTLPVDVSSDALDVNQEDGSALFKGNVMIAQGEMRLSADTVLVINKSDGGGIERLEADGSVLLVSGEDAAEAQTAQYTIDSGTIDMQGDVLLTQGVTTLTAQRMLVNLTTGEATLTGRVKTTLNGGKN